MRSLRQVNGVRLQGPVGELWLHGCKAGLLFDWTFEGWEAEWEIRAERYKLDPLLVKNGQRQMKAVLDTRAGRLEAKGNVWTDFVADGHSRRAMVIKGERGLTWQTRPAAPVSQQNA